MVQSLNKIILGAIFMALCATRVGAAVGSGVKNSAPESVVLPNGCGNPYADVPEFISFFESAIQLMAAKRGAEAKGVVDLFSVSEIRSEMRQLFPSLGEESPVDRLIISQLCNYQKIHLLSASMTSTKVESSLEKLHDHLAAIAGPMYKDSKKLMLAAVNEMEKNKQAEGLVAAKWSDIRKARQMGRKQVRDLFDE